MPVRGPPAVSTTTAISSLELLMKLFSERGFNPRLSQLAKLSDCNNQSNHDTEAYALEHFLLFTALCTKF
jgi:hypothetical protein